MENKLTMQIIGGSKIDENFKFEKDSIFEAAGAAASICYDDNANNSLSKFLNDTKERKIKRGKSMANVGHGSPIEHTSVSLLFHNISKIQTMILNNQRVYSLTERSFRYSKPEHQSPLYKEWLDRLTLSGMQRKRAQEIARYMISVFERNSTAYYTMNIRQINVLLRMFEEFVAQNSNSKNDFLKEVCKHISNLYLALKPFDIGLEKNKYQKLKLFENEVPEEFVKSGLYLLSSKVSPVALGQLQRHRSLTYKIVFNETDEYYIPPIIERLNLKLKWLDDAKTVNFPNCKLLTIYEYGEVADFMMKYDIRKGPEVQEETRDNVLKTKERLDKLIS